MRKVFLISIILSLFACQQENINSVLTNLQTQSSKFEINNKQDTTLILKSGIKIKISANSFDYSSDSLITLKIIDLGKKSDIIKYGISTVSDDKILQTRGMINISAFSSGKELILKANKSIKVYFPRKSTDSNYMNLFIGEKSENNTVNWKFDSTYYNTNTAYITDWDIWPDFDANWKNSRLSGINDRMVDSLLYAFYKNFDISKMSSPLNKIEDRYHVFYKFSVSKEKYEFIIKRWLGAKDDTIFYDSLQVDKYVYDYVKNFPAVSPFIKNNDLRYYIIRVFFSIGQMPENYYDSFTKSLSYTVWQTNDWVGKETEDDTAYKQDSLDYFILNSNKLGWINCDYFIDFKGVMKTIELPIEKKYNYKAALIFKNYRSVLWVNSYNDKITFNNVPMNEAVSLLIIRKNKILEFSRIETTIDSISKIDFEFKSITLNELEHEINLIE